MNLTYKEKVTKIARDMGASKIGFANLGGHLPENLKHLKTGIAIVVRLSDQIINDVVDKPTQTYFHHYRSVNFLIDQITLKVGSLLQEDGYLSMAVPASQTVKTERESYTGIFQHKTTATLSGMGWIGKNGCLVTDSYGPRVRLGTILTNLDIDYDEPIIKSKCGDCDLCVTSCPALALQGNHWHQEMERDKIIDAFACSTHMSEAYKEIGRGSVCGICVSRCPKGKEVLRR